MFVSTRLQLEYSPWTPFQYNDCTWRGAMQLVHTPQQCFTATKMLIGGQVTGFVQVQQCEMTFLAQYLTFQIYFRSDDLFSMDNYALTILSFSLHYKGITHVSNWSRNQFVLCCLAPGESNLSAFLFPAFPLVNTKPLLTLFSVGYFLRTESVEIFGNFFGAPPK